MKRVLKRNVLLSLLFLLFSVSLSAQYVNDSYPESYTVREKIIDTWFTEDISVIRDKSSEILQTNIGDYFLVRAEEHDGLMEIIVSPLVVQTFNIVEYDVLLDGCENTDSTKTVQIETWPKEALGSWILYRDVATGKPVKIRQYIMPDSEIFLEFFNTDLKTTASFSIFGGLVANQVSVVVPFDFFYTSSMKDIVGVTMRFPWEYIKTNNQIYAETKYMISVIHENLPALADKTLLENDTDLGFLKWIIDGLVEPLVGGRVFDDALIASTVKAQATYSSPEDAYATYDYTRNLATASHSADTGISYTANTSSVDVALEPFGFFVDDDGVKKRVEYIAKNGYNNEILKSILYILTTTEPQLFYLGAIRNPAISEANGKTIEYYSYNHAVAFFPWFDEDGYFHVKVFQDGKEFSFDKFLSIYPDSFTHLVRVKSSMNFFPLITEKN